MTASDDARRAITEEMHEWGGYYTANGLTVQERRIAADILAAVMPDGRTIAQHLDDGAEWQAWGQVAAHVLRAILDDPAAVAGLRRAADLLARLEADR